MGVDDNEKGQSLDEYEDVDDGDDIGYVPLLFVAVLPLRKELNHLTDMGERTRSLNHLVCILKIDLSYNC